MSDSLTYKIIILRVTNLHNQLNILSAMSNFQVAPKGEKKMKRHDIKYDTRREKKRKRQNLSREPILANLNNACC